MTDDLELEAGIARLARSMARTMTDPDYEPCGHGPEFLRRGLCTHAGHDVGAGTPPVEYGSCGSLGWTVEKWGRVTHKHTCPNRVDPFCQTHPTGCLDTGAGTPLTAEEATARLRTLIENVVTTDEYRVAYRDALDALSRPATDRLRDALDALVVGGPIDNDRYIDDPTYHAIVDVWRRAPRPATDLAGLDVEQLAEAMAWAEGDFVGKASLWTERAQRLITALARLSVADGPGPTDAE